MSPAGCDGKFKRFRGHRSIEIWKTIGDECESAGRAGMVQSTCGSLAVPRCAASEHQRGYENPIRRGWHRWDIHGTIALLVVLLQNRQTRTF